VRLKQISVNTFKKFEHYIFAEAQLDFILTIKTISNECEIP
jgi:predicted ATP-binding protein involved in virulence